MFQDRNALGLWFVRNLGLGQYFCHVVSTLGRDGSFPEAWKPLAFMRRWGLSPEQLA